MFLVLVEVFLGFEVVLLSLSLSISNVAACFICRRKDLIIMFDRFCSLQNAKAKTESTSAEENWSTASTTAAYDILYLPIDFRQVN